MSLFEFEVTVKHDNGKIKIVTVARSIGALVHIVMAAEGCPERSIINIKRLKEVV